MNLNLSNSFAFFLIAFISVGQSWAQKGGQDEGPVGIFSSGREYDEFMGNAKRAAYGPDGNPELRAMIPMLNDIALNRPLGWTSQRYGGQGGSLDLLSDEKVRAELDLVDQQFEDLQAMNEAVQKRVGEQIRGLDFSDRENLMSQIQKIREEANRDLNSVLLPHQLDRLKQLRSQTLLRNRSFVDVITSEPLKTDLEISDEQSDDLKKTEQDIERELERKIAKLREEAQKEIISKLKRKQREKVEEIFGERFEFQIKPNGNRRRPGRKTAKPDGRK